MWAIDDESTLTGTFELYGYAPWPRGRTMRACIIPGTRMLCTYVYTPVTLSGMSMRTTGFGSLRTVLYADIGFAGATPGCRATLAPLILNSLPPISEP